jgi:heterokaryon incompatibility protein (HET)
MNGQLMEVRYNLYTALQYLRSTTQPQRLWIDALTINQDDFPERNQQIQTMGQIYKNSHETIVWLREEKDSDRHALNLLHVCDGLANDDTVTMEEKYIHISNSIFQRDESNIENMISSLHRLCNFDLLRTEHD